MNTLVLLIGVIDVLQSFELDSMGLMTFSLSFLLPRRLKHPCQVESVFVVNLDVVLLLHVLDIVRFLRHHEAQTFTRGGDTSCSSNSVHVLLDLTREVPLDDPSDIFEIKSTRSNIGAHEKTAFFFVETEEVDFTVTVVHVSVQLEHVAIKQRLGLRPLRFVFVLENDSASLLVTSSSLVDNLGPVELLEKLSKVVDRLTVTGEHDDLHVLMHVQEHQQVDQTVLHRHLASELLHLPWNRSNHVGIARDGVGSFFNIVEACCHIRRH